MRESQDYHLCHWHHHDSEAVDQVGGCIGGTDGRTRGRNLKRSKGILLIPVPLTEANVGNFVLIIIIILINMMVMISKKIKI